MYKPYHDIDLDVNACFVACIILVVKECFYMLMTKITWPFMTHSSFSIFGFTFLKMAEDLIQYIWNYMWRLLHVSLYFKIYEW